MSEHALLSAARALVPEIAARAAEVEAARRLPADLARTLAEAGLMRMLVPADLGGLEASPWEMVESIEAIASGDGAVGWCVMIAATTGLTAAYLTSPTDREVFGNPLTITGGVLAPKGTARAVDGGYEVTGRWAFASGCDNCGWLVGGCLVMDGEEVRDLRVMVFPAESVTIHDTWSVSGLRGTGSNDMEVDAIFVPSGRAFSLFERPEHGGQLYAFPLFGLLAVGIASVALGIGRAALDDVMELAGAKVPTGHRAPLATRSSTQSSVAQAEAQLGAARALLAESVAAAWAQAASGGPLDPQARARLRLAATHATTVGAHVTEVAYRLGGATSIYDSSPLQRRFRDSQVATQHMMVAPATWELVGKVLLGVDTDTSQL